MGCISSKLLAHQEDSVSGGINHVVSLTSTTYGALDLAAGRKSDVAVVEKTISREWKRSPRAAPAPTLSTSSPAAKVDAGMEIVNAWEIMAGLDDEPLTWSPLKRKDKKGVLPSRLWSPARAAMSPKSAARKKTGPAGKENNPRQWSGSGQKRGGASPALPLRPANSWDWGNLVAPPNSAAESKKCTPKNEKVIRRSATDSGPRTRSGGGSSSSRRSLSPLFDPDLLAQLERELRDEGEQIKKKADLLESFALKCPPRGDAAIVLYSTTLRGIRKTFEECNAVRAALESNGVQFVERDVSMDAGYKEELRQMLGSGSVPALFVKGRHVGGAEAVAALEEDGLLAMLLEGMPLAGAEPCKQCGGARFVMCGRCSGSSKVRNDGEKAVVKCSECNENGLLRCNLCS